MRVVVTGATGNVGTSLVASLAREPAVTRITGLSRRRPEWSVAKTDWVEADVTSSPLDTIFEGADAVVHLAWVIQPSRDERVLHDINVEGSRRVFEAAARAGVPALVHASSIGVYSRGPKQSRVREDWPREGVASSFYSRHKVAAEQALDEFERANSAMRVVRLRPALIFKRESATEIRRYFAGPLLPSQLVRHELIPLVPAHPRLKIQCVHADDVADAYRRVVVSDTARGAYNIAAEPVLDADELARVLGAQKVPVHASALRAAAMASFRLRLHPTPEGWLDMGLDVPLLDTTRAREELGWTPRHAAGDVLLELLTGMRESAGFPTPPLDPGTSGPGRIRELLTGIGGRN